MSTAAAAALAIVISLAALMALGRTDAKRLRSLQLFRRDGRERLRPLRRAAGLGAVLPGVALAACGAWPALLIWLGATISAGWLIAQLLSAHRPRRE